MKKIILTKIAFIAFVCLSLCGCDSTELTDKLTKNIHNKSSDGQSSKLPNSIQGKLGDGQSPCSNFDKKELFPNIFGKYSGDDYAFKYFNIINDKQKESLFNVQVNYMEIKRSEKESVCAYVANIDKKYNEMQLSSQEIEQLERALVNNNMYSKYEQSKELQESYFNALKFLKYHNIQIPNDYQGLNQLDWVIDTINRYNMTIIQVVYGKVIEKMHPFDMMGSMIVASPYYDAFRIYSAYLSLNELAEFLSKENGNNCNLSGEDAKSKCANYIKEIRAIKNFAESVLK